MKKTIIILSMLAVICSINAQIIEFVTDGELDSAVIDPSVKSNVWVTDRGVWFARYRDADKTKATIQTQEETGKGKVIYFKALEKLPDVGNNPVAAQKLVEKCTAETYRLSFWAKYTGDVQAKLAPAVRRLNVGTKVAFMKAGWVYSPGETTSGAWSAFTLTPEWQYYSIDFDMSKLVSSFASPSYVTGQGGTYTVSDANDSDLSNVYIAFSNYNTKDAEILIDDISFAPSAMFENPDSWLNPGFEYLFAKPTLTSYVGHPSAYDFKGYWNLHYLPIAYINGGITYYNGAKNKGSISVDKTTANTGSKSMKLVVDTINARYNLYVVSSLVGLPEDNYRLRFYAKASLADIPFRIDINTYNADNGKNNGLYNGTVMHSFTTSTDWTECSFTFSSVGMQDTMSFVIHPHTQASGAIWGWNDTGDTFTPATYWFDDFKLESTTATTTFSDGIGEMQLQVMPNRIIVKNIQDKQKVQLFDVSGQLIAEKIASDRNIDFDVNQKGLYIVRAGNISGKVIVH